MDTFGQELKRIRNSYGETQQAFAKRIKVGRPTLAGYETGSRPTEAGLDALCELLPEHSQDLRDAFNIGTNAELDANDGPLDEEQLSEMFRSRSRSNVTIEGHWFALWQTVVNGEENFNHEELTVEKGRRLWHMKNVDRSLENPDGGYLWHAECRLYDNQFLLGTYISREPSVRSKGTIYLVLHPNGRSMVGHWVGCNHDSDWGQGLFALARDDNRVDGILERHIDRQPPMPYASNRRMNKEN